MLILSIINFRQSRMLHFIPRRELRQFCSKFLVRLSTILTPISILFHTFAFNHLMPPKLRFFIETTKKKAEILQAISKLRNAPADKQSQLCCVSTPSQPLAGKVHANERNESSLSNCRVQLNLSKGSAG